MTRAMIFDPKTRGLREVTFQQPIPYDALYLTGLDRKEEAARHRIFVERAKENGILVINDEVVAERSDDKLKKADYLPHKNSVKGASVVRGSKPREMIETDSSSFW